MDRYVTGAVIRKLRESKKITQEELAERIHVSDKAISKWETGQGFPDISLPYPVRKAISGRERGGKIQDGLCKVHIRLL